MNRTKIIVAVNDLALAGAQRLAVDLLRGLDDSFEPHLVVLTQVSGRGDFYDQVPAHVQVHKLQFKGFADLGQWWALIKILHAIRPDIVKTALFFSNTVFALLKPLFGYTLITAEHNTQITKNGLQRFLNTVLLPLSHTTVVDSRGVADTLSHHEGIKRSQFTVIYNGVNLNAIQKAESSFASQRNPLRADLGIGQGDMVFLTVSRLVGQKNHELMINAFGELCKKRGDCKLLIVGDGGFLEPRKEQARTLGLEGKVIFTGEQKEVYRYYALADAFIMTSRHEGFCIAAMEGLAFGLPLVSTCVAGISEYLKDGVNGYFTEQNANDIAEKMNTIADNAALFAEAAKQTAAAYSLNRYQAAYRDLFLKIVRG